MFLRIVFAGAAAAIVAPCLSASAQTATQIVRFQVNAVNQLAVTGNPSPLVVNTATAGSAPTAATSSGTSYAITTNEPNQKITASIDQPMPSGLALEVSLAAPAGASSAGNVQLGTASSDVVTGIANTASASLPITYRLLATPAAQVVGPSSRTVTLTIVAGT
jgi:hypothetical protein